MTADTVARPRTGYLPRGYLRVSGGARRAVLVHRRAAAVTVIVAALAVCAVILTVVSGQYALSVRGVLGVLFQGAGSDTDRFVVLGQRLPRSIAAALVGAALAVSGAIFQTVSRNALASPDIVGFTTGSATGGLLAILVIGRSTSTSVMTGAIVGGAVTALCVVAIASRRRMAGDRLILAGIAVAAMLASVNDFLISRAPLEGAEAAKAWQHGSLHNTIWRDLAPIGVVLVLALPVALALGRRLRQLELGDQAAAGLGIDVSRTRIATIAIGVVLAAAAVATAGPIGFLALAAPQLARRAARTPGIPLVTSAAMGMLLLVTADLLAQRLLAPFEIPVGLVTAALGGGYLLWLLVTRRA